jgi:hypothetical protein
MMMFCVIIQFMSKYPRTFHFPFSPGVSNDDKVQHDLSALLNTPVVITVKMDGSNVCMTREDCFARSHSSAPKHPSFDMFKSVYNNIKWSLPDDLQIFGEWLYAKHSIPYNNLPSYLLVFGMRDTTKDMWLAWDTVQQYAEILGLNTVPVIHRCTYKTLKELEIDIRMMATDHCQYGEQEGCVVRVAGEFSSDDFSKNVVKYVRANHVQSSEHWSHQEIVPNNLFVENK